MRQRLIDLCNQRAAQIAAAEAALAAGNTADYDSAMTQIQNMNSEIDRIQNLLREQERQMANQPAPSGAEARDMAEERGAALLRGDRVTFNFAEVRRGIQNATTLATGTIVQPTGSGTDVREGHNAVVSSVVDQVYVTDLTGMGAFLEPYVIEDTKANAGKVEALAGTARAESDPKFGVAEIKPYEVNTTSFVDRNIARLSPANYYARVQAMAMRALRRKVAGLIVNGDGASSPTMFGLTNAKNKAGEAIFASQALGAAIDPTTLDDLYFAYGSSEACGANARLLLTKANLKAIGKLRGTNEKQRLFKITPDAANPNTGIISDGGLVLPYTLVSDIGDATLGYGDLMNYELGLFGEYSIRVDESVKAVERMTAILGDVFVGGNLIVDKGFVVGTIG
ncbi:MAG: phage major capsid protein [Oscillibacter sp.]|nr:phage major capsid protein [Oscillibacter sp.]MBQ7778794.1 phage major capsid protein [Oscillibacter sp.]